MSTPARGQARAIAHPNIALAKYWGKLDVPGNLPAVPSLSITLAGMSTTTTVGFGPGLEADRVLLHGAPASEKMTARVVALLDRVRAAAGVRTRAWVETANDFPTASGLASSASGFAALALAAVRASGLEWDDARVSDLARQSSASAARSIFGGFATLGAGPGEDGFLPAEPLADAGHWDLAVTIAVATEEQKAVGSTEGMRRSKETSPYHASWVASAPASFARVREAVVERDLEALAAAAEHSALAMHACTMAAVPPIVYLRPVTLAVLERVHKLRAEGTLCFATMDAGPHVKVISEARDADVVERAVREVAGVVRIIRARPGGPATVTVAGGGRT